MVKYKNLEDMVDRKGSTCDEILKKLNLSYIASERLNFAIPPAKYELSDLNSMLELLLPSKVKKILQLMILDYYPRIIRR